MGNDTILGRAGSGNVDDLSASQVKSILDYAAIDVSFDDTGLSITATQTEVQGAIGALDTAVLQNSQDITNAVSDLGDVITKVNTVVEDYDDLTDFPAPGYSTAFYRALDTGIMYTWNGASYDPIGTTGGGGGISEELAVALAVAL
jgi:hypothetical protein